MTRALVAALALLLVAAECEEDLEGFPQRAVDRSDRAPLPDGTTWISSPWPGQVDDPANEGLIEIEPQAGLRLYHGLGRDPVEVQCYVAFDEVPARVMPGAGNACEVHEVGTDEDGRFVVIRNGSGGSFFYRFLLR
jgi:hypothetical protein